MTRKNIDAADEILGLKFPVLNNGWVGLVDYCGGDEMIESFARTSYGKGTRPVSDRRALIRYLVSHYHTTPIECTEISFDIALPIHVARQLVRHRTFSPINEYSARYSIVPEVLYEDYELNLQSKNNKQGRNDDIVTEADLFSDKIKDSHVQAFALYNDMVNAGVAREIARMHLPLNCYTYWFCKMDLNNLFKMLRLRLDSHAQDEIREYAGVIAGIVKRVAPLAFEAFFDYHYCASSFSKFDKELLNVLLDMSHSYNSPDATLTKKGLELGMTKREIDDFFNKIQPSKFKFEDFDLDPSKATKEVENV